jgi:hypothetical protein
MPSLPNTRRPHLATGGAVASYILATSALALSGTNRNETLLLDA